MVSVIIPTYNRTDLLVFAIERVLMQKNVEIEIIVINDNKDKDPTDDIVLRYPQVIYVKNSEHMGLGKNHQIGMRLAHGEYINFHDDDDYLCDNLFFKKATQILDSDKSLAFVSGNAYRKYEGSLSDQSVIQTEKRCLNVRGKYDGMDYLSKFQIEYHKPLSTFPTIFRRSKLEEWNFDEQIEMSDSSIYMLSLLSGNAYFMDDFVGVYRVHNQSMTRKGSDLNWRMGVFAQKEYILWQIKNSIKNPLRWWDRQFILTYRYFAVTSYYRDEKIALLKWGMIHHNNSHLLRLHIVFYFLIALLFNK